MEYNKHYQTQNVSDTQRLTNMQSKLTKDTSNTKTMETQQKLSQKNYQTLICSVEDFLAKHSQSLENGEVFKIPEEHSFLILQELLKLKDLKLFSLKMSKGYSITTKGKLSESSFKRFQNWGMMFNGWFLTANFSEFPRTEKGCSLSEILEEQVDQKYYLSEKMQKRFQEYIIDSSIEKETIVNKTDSNTEGISPTLQKEGSNDIKIASCITANYWKGPTNNPKERTMVIGSTQKNAGVMKDCSTCLGEAMGKGGGHIPMVLATRKKDRDKPREQRDNSGYGQQFEPRKDDVTNTISSFDKDNYIATNKLRRLTPRECERLQGFPDDWTLVPNDKGKPMSDTQRYKMMGNAVTVNVIKAISSKLKEATKK